MNSPLSAEDRVEIARCARCGGLPRPTLLGRTICDRCGGLDVPQPPSAKVLEQAAALTSNERLIREFQEFLDARRESRIDQSFHDLVAWVRDRLSGETSPTLPRVVVEASAALEDLAYYNGAKQALAMASQSMKAAEEWLAGGCGNRVAPARAALKAAAPLADDDGPGEEDGPWAEGWAERSALKTNDPLAEIQASAAEGKRILRERGKELCRELSDPRSARHKPYCAAYNGEIGFKHGVRCTCGAESEDEVQS